MARDLLRERHGRMHLVVRAERVAGVWGLATVAALLPVPTRLAAQSTGTIRGQVISAHDQEPLRGVTISVLPRGSAVTDANGRYLVTGVSPGIDTILFSVLGHGPQQRVVTVTAGSAETVDVALEPVPVRLGDIEVAGVSRQPERIVEAPAAVSVVDPARVRDLAVTGQTPLLVADLPGVHAAQSGVYDFNVNLRGFNSLLTRRVLVLVDGRDVSLPILGMQEWPDLSIKEETGRVEVIRGPGSALYGANAFTGVLSISTPAVREDRGTRLRLGGGELSSLRADGRHSAISRDLRWGFRITGGYSQSVTWDRSRTNVGDLDREYAGADPVSPVNAPVPGFEALPLRGQTKAGAFGLPGAATGNADPVRTYGGAGRLDHYLTDGSILTAEGGVSRIENPINTTPSGRSQIYSADRPWGRLAWSAEHVNVMAYYTGRSGRQFELASGTETFEKSGTVHIEGQFNHGFAGARGRFVAGASARNSSVDSKGTILSVEGDKRADQTYGVFGLAEYSVASVLKLVLAGRLDAGTVSDAQVSPKIGVVITPHRNQTLRFTLNRAFLTPSPLVRFLQVPAGLPLDLTALEGGLRASPLGPALLGVPNGALFTNSSAVPLLALGNSTIRPERATGLEVGYKAQIGQVFFTADGYYSYIRDFTSNVLPGANALYPAWTAPAAVPPAARAPLEAAVAGAVGPGLSRLGDGSTAYVLSWANAGKSREWGAELAIALPVTDRARLDANYTYYHFRLEQQSFLLGDSLLPNTPTHTANVALTYQGTSRLRARAGLRLVSSFEWWAGLWRGTVPSSQIVDLTASYRVSPRLQIGVVGTDAFNRRRYEVYGGSIVGRRVLGGVTWEP